MRVITRTRGDTYPDVVSLRLKSTRAPYDVSSGFTFSLVLDTLPSPPDDTTQLFSVDGVVDNATPNTVSFTMTTDQANRVGSFFYDIRMFDPAGLRRTIDSGEYRFV
jgi:hypothetical protein